MGLVDHLPRWATHVAGKLVLAVNWELSQDEGQAPLFHFLSVDIWLPHNMMARLEQMSQGNYSLVYGSFMTYFGRLIASLLP